MRLYLNIPINQLLLKENCICLNSPQLMVRLKMANSPRIATQMIEHGHIRVGTDTIMDPAFLVPRHLEDSITWTQGSKYRQHIAKYQSQYDDYEH
ncbi:hypothetical protein P9112_012078 [Eukaryota sp. TZLM1-RC]